MSTIVIALLDYVDRESYDTYIQKAGPIFMREGVKLIVNDEAPTFLTPEIKADKVVVMEFEDDAHMGRFFALPDYQDAAKHRDKGVTMRTIKVSRFTGFD